MTKITIQIDVDTTDIPSIDDIMDVLYRQVEITLSLLPIETVVRVARDTFIATSYSEGESDREVSQ